MSKVDRIKSQIDEIYYDGDSDRETTLERLEEIKEHVDRLVEDLI